MTTNLVDRVPVPGSLGVQVTTNIVVHIQTDDAVLSTTVTIKLNGVNAILLGTFQTGYSGTLVSDGSNGWVATINPTQNLPNNTVITVLVQCTETTGPTPFSQQYTFQTRRDIGIAASVTYYEEGDVVEADIWAHEGQTTVPETLDTIELTIRRQGSVVDRVLVANAAHQMHTTSGAFHIRFLHPNQISRDMTFDLTASVDGYQAPGIGTLQLSQTLAWEGRGNQMASQPARPGQTLPRTEPSVHDLSTQQQAAAQYEVVEVRSGDASVLPTVLVDLDFLNATQYIQGMEGDLQYTGGGNRLLVGIADTTDWFLQETSELPVTFGARQMLEGQAVNLLPNSSLVTNDFELTLPDGSVRADVETSELTNGVNQLVYAVEGSVIYDGTDRLITISSPKIDIMAGEPVLCSVLARATLRDDKVTLDTFTMRVRFYNVADTQVGSVDFNYDIFAFESDTTFKVMEGYVASGSVPVTATQASFDIVVGSWEGCDLMNLWIAAPMIEHATFSTSRVVGVDAAMTRNADDMRIPQRGNISQRNGRITLNWAPQYDVTPPTNVTLFDTRSSILRSGYTLRHRTDGRLELSAVDAAGTAVQAVSTDPIALTAGEPVELTGQWTPTSLRIMLGQQVVAEQLGTYSQPTVVQDEITIGQKVGGTEPLYGEVHRFRSFGTA